MTLYLEYLGGPGGTYLHVLIYAQAATQTATHAATHTATHTATHILTCTNIRVGNGGKGGAKRSQNSVWLEKDGTAKLV